LSLEQGWIIRIFDAILLHLYDTKLNVIRDITSSIRSISTQCLII